MSFKKAILSPLPTKLLEKVVVTSAYITPLDKLKIVSFLNKLSLSVEHITDTDVVEKTLDIGSYDILLTNLNQNNHTTLRNLYSIPQHVM